MNSTSLAKKGLNSNEYVELIKIFTLALEKHKDYMNSLNVFPVPDADTGTNMYVSVKGIQDSLKDKPNSNKFDELSKSVADFALLSAQGNSGLLIAQLFRGINSAMKGSNELGLKELSESLDKTYEYAYTSVHEPQEGTMITIMRECASKAKSLEDKNEFSLNEEIEQLMELNSEFKKLVESIKNENTKKEEYLNISYTKEQYSEAVSRMYLHFANIKIDELIYEFEQSEDKNFQLLQEVEDIKKKKEIYQNTI